jgi:DNA repair exonuclease SbcCD ATPase subunit
MKPITLIIENFGSFQGRHVIKLDVAGLVAFRGLNLVNPGQRGNGTGKSTVLDAYLWGSFGETGPRKETSSSNSGLKSDDVINEVVGKGTVVQVIFEAHDGDLYRIERWRKARDKDAERLKPNGVRLDMSERGYGPNPENWESVHDLDATPTQEEIDRLLGVDYSLALKLLIRSQEDPHNFAQATAKERFDILTQIEGVTELDDIESRARTRGLEVLKEINQLDADVLGHERTLSILQDEDPKAQAADWERQRGVDVEAVLARIEKVKADEGQHAQVAATKPALLAKLAELDDALRALVTQTEPAEVAQWREVLLGKNAEAGGIQARLAVLKAQQEKIDRVQGVCTECGQHVDEAHVRERQATVEHDIAHETSTLQECDKARAEAQAVITTTVTEMERYRLAIQQQRDAVNTERSQVNQQVYQASSAEVAQGQIVAEVTRLTAEWSRRANEANPYTAQSEALASRINQVAATLEERRTTLAGLKTEAGLVEWWARAVPSMKSWIFDNVVGEITANANRWLQHFMAGTCLAQIESTKTTKTGKVKDEIGLKLFRWEHNAWHERPYRRWSGGEKRRIAVAIDWALADRLGQRSSFKCSFMALDEIDRHIDDEGKEGLLNALAELRREKDTIWIISQDEDFNAAPDISWTVIKDENGSRIEETKNDQQEDKTEEQQAA